MRQTEERGNVQFLCPDLAMRRPHVFTPDPFCATTPPAVLSYCSPSLEVIMPLQAAPTGVWLPAFQNPNGCLNALSVPNAGNYIGGIGNIGHSPNGLWRVDRQNPPVGMSNLQIQRNGAQNPSTAACVHVANAYTALIGPIHVIPPNPWGAAGSPALSRYKELTRAIQNGLRLSAASHHVNHHGNCVIQVYQVQGNFSS